MMANPFGENMKVPGVLSLAHFGKPSYVGPCRDPEVGEVHAQPWAVTIV